MLTLGYTNQAYQVWGSLSHAGHLGRGRGNYIGTFAGAIFITLLSSILSVMQMPPAARQIIFGAIILVVLLIHGLTSKGRDI
ncbi:hypothetical protein CK224_08165 [Mesorhizobium sp. WSM3862]|nr:hypothetical protein CK224_08165 [Mesorhizobium sp. WSM3862]